MQQGSMHSATVTLARRLLVVPLGVILWFGAGTAVMVWAIPRGESVAVWRTGYCNAVPPPIIADLMTNGDLLQVLEADSWAITEYSLQMATPAAPGVPSPTQTQYQVTALGFPARFLRISTANVDQDTTGIEAGHRFAPGAVKTIRWRELLFDLVVWGVTGIALRALVSNSMSRRARVAIRAVAAGMWMTLLLAWLAPLLTFPSLQRLYLSRAAFAAELGVLPDEPRVAGTTFVGNHRRGLMLTQIDWMYCSTAPTDRVAVVVGCGAMTTLGFPFGALRDREWVWEASRLRIPELGSWRAICWILRMPPTNVGFFSDWIVWGVGWLGVMTAPTAIRRVRRSRRAQCPACGYPRSPSALRCSECGAECEMAWIELTFPNDEPPANEEDSNAWFR